jgi:hypothetical protein
MPLFPIMAGLDPAIHVFCVTAKEDVDARHKAGHDEGVRSMQGRTGSAALPINSVAMQLADQNECAHVKSPVVAGRGLTWQETRRVEAAVM